MKQKFQSLSLEKFQASSINPERIYGGANKFTNDNLPSGGSTCDTGGGSNGAGSYESDTDASDPDGNLLFRECHSSIGGGLPTS